MDKINERLDELSQLEAGWCNGSGEAICSKVIEDVREFFGLNFIDVDNVIVNIFPLIGGGVEVYLDGGGGSSLVMDFTDSDELGADGYFTFYRTPR